MLMTMRTSRTLLLVLVLLGASLAPLMMPGQLDASQSAHTEGRDLVDFTVTDFSMGNATDPAVDYEQGDGSIQQYLLRARTYEFTVTFQNVGSGLIATDATGIVDIVHPVGFVVETFTFNITLIGGQSTVETFEWTPEWAHSTMDANEDLSGGYILRGTVDGGVLDSNEENDVYEERAPVAIWRDAMEGTQITYDVPTWIGIAYETRTPNKNIQGLSNFNIHNDSSASPVGDNHWRFSGDDSDYSSNNVEMLKWGWFSNDGSCADPGHGLGWGMGDTDYQAVGANVCLVQVNDFDFLTLHWVTWASGSMGAGDEFALEAVRSFNDIGQHNLTEAGIPGGEHVWEKVVWNMTDVHPDNSMQLSYTKIADASGASSGMEFDEFILFGIQRVQEYTVELDCNDPLPNAYVVIPADPNPPSLHCTVTNNGYRTVTMTIRTDVSNDTWMQGFPLRIDSTNLNDHDDVVTMNPLPAGESAEFWVNLSIPDGADVESLFWNVSLTDAVSHETKAALVLPVSVDAAYAVGIDQVTLANPAAILAPGASSDVLMRLKNTGNQDASFSLSAFFNDSKWDLGDLAWFEDWDEDGNLTAMTSTEVALVKNEVREVVARFTAPDDVEPGLVEVNLVASGVAPANAQSVKRLILEVPVLEETIVTPSVSEFTAHATGLTRTVEVAIVNNGNAPARYDLALVADWRIEAYLNTEVTEEIDPFGGETSVMVILPMKHGLAPSFYLIEIVATSQDNPLHSERSDFTLEVPTTYVVEVADEDMSGQTFRAGEAEEKTLNFEIFNHGNADDAFTVELDLDEGIIATIVDGLNDGRTPYIAPQTSTNVTVTYRFAEGTNGARTLAVEATSVSAAAEGADVQATGEAVFQVGNVGWIALTPGPQIYIDVADTHTTQITVHNRHPAEDQQVRLQVEQGDAVYYVDQVFISQDEREFVLGPDEQRIISLNVRVTETNLAMLISDEMHFNVTIHAEADDDVADVTIPLLVKKVAIVDEDPSESGGQGLAQTIVIWVMGVGLILGLLVVLVQVLRGGEEEDEIRSLEMGYESSMGDGLPDAPSLPSAPVLPSSDSTANSMYGGSQAIFEQPVMETPPAPAPAPAAPAPAAPAPEPAPAPAPAAPAGGPPLPADGLPEGWTMEQWTHYGEEYLRRSGGA